MMPMPQKLVYLCFTHFLENTCTEQIIFLIYTNLTAFRQRQKRKEEEEFGKKGGWYEPSV